MRNTSDFGQIRTQGDARSARERLLSLLLAADDKRRQSSRAITPRGNWEGPIPLSYAQESLWFLDHVGLIGAAYNVCGALRLSGKLEEAALERSFTELVRRHESLRTRFEALQGVPHQIIEAPGVFPLHREDISHVADSNAREDQLCLSMRREQLHRFNLKKGPLLRVVLVRLGTQEHALLLTMHHIVVDGWSLAVLVDELSSLYASYVRGELSPLPELVVQYADYAIWQRKFQGESAFQEHLRYWKERLLGAPPQLQLATDRPRPALESFKGAMLRFELSRSLSAALNELAGREGATLFMVVLAAYQVLLSRWSGQHDIVVGVPIAARRNLEVERLIGFFVNPLALRTEVLAELSFRQLLKQVKEVTLEGYAHQDLPFETLVAELRPERDLTMQPVFQVALVLENFPEARLDIPGVAWTWMGTDSATTHFDLTLYLYESANGLTGAFEYATDLFDKSTIERMARHFRRLLDVIISSPERLLRELSSLDEAEKERVLVEWNLTAAAYPRERCVHDLFAEQVQRSGDAVAVTYGSQSLTYAELNRRANQLGRYLMHQGVGLDRVVGICLERSLEMLVGVLGILKAGGAYVPLDPNYPLERLRYMLEDAAPEVVLTHEELRAVLPAMRAEVITLNEKLKDIAGYVDEDVPPAELGLSSADLVYLIYTSGSTGRPKGTAMAHRSMVNLIEWHRQIFHGQESRRVLQFAALSFDVAFQEIFSTLCTGGTLVLPDEWVRRDARALMDLLSSQRIERLFVPPLMLQSLAECCRDTDAVALGLQDVITAGEQLRVTPEMAGLFSKLDGCRLHNHYGPTETHVVTALTLNGDPGQWPALPAIGRPVANTQIYVLDAQRQPVPIGVVGEIYIGGAGVARGYMGHPEVTAQRFTADPFTAEAGARLYRSGDLGRRRADGMLEYLGRNDDQVKIRGYRIELGEIEGQLVRHERLRDAVVVAREDVPGERRLVAYVTPRDQVELSPEELRMHLKATLPEYMVPSAFVVLQSLPLTPSGKLNRRALPQPDQAAYTSEQYEPPQGEVEQALAQIWQELLHVPRVSRRDNFFELGGHSLHGAKLVAKVAERLKAPISVVTLFQYPTIQEMAMVVESLELLGGDPLSCQGAEFEGGVV